MLSPLSIKRCIFIRRLSIELFTFLISWLDSPRSARQVAWAVSTIPFVLRYFILLVVKKSIPQNDSVTDIHHCSVVQTMVLVSNNGYMSEKQKFMKYKIPDFKTSNSRFEREYIDTKWLNCLWLFMNNIQHIYAL